MRVKIAFLLVVLGVVFVGAQSVKRPILGDTNWQDPNRGAPEKLLAFHEPTLFYENEYTGMMCFSKDGFRYVSNLFYFKLGPQLKWGITVSVYTPEGKYYLGKAEIDPKKVVFSRDSIEVRFGESYITGKNPNYKVHYVTDKVTVDLSFKSRGKIYSLASTGHFKFGPGDKYFLEGAIATPWADVSGAFTIEGKKRQFNGQGYIDHGRYSIPFNRHMPAWEGFIAFTWEPIDGHMYNITVFDYLTHPEFGGKRIANLFVLKDDEIIFATPFYNLEPLDWKKEPSLNIDFPWKYTVKTVEGTSCSLQGISKAQYTWELLDIFGELPDYIRAIALKFLKRPVYWRAFGTFDGTLTCGGETVRFKNIPSFHDANYVR